MANERDTEPRARHDESELSDDALDAVAGGRRSDGPIVIEPPSIGLPVTPIVEYAPFDPPTGA